MITDPPPAAAGQLPAGFLSRLRRQQEGDSRTKCCADDQSGRHCGRFARFRALRRACVGHPSKSPWFVVRKLRLAVWTYDVYQQVQGRWTTCPVT